MRNQFRFPETVHFIIAKPKPVTGEITGLIIEYFFALLGLANFSQLPLDSFHYVLDHKKFH